MDSFIHLPAMSGHLAHSPKAFGHMRSLSAVPASSLPFKPKPPPKSPSTSQLPIITLSPKTAFFPNNEMSTLPDPRNRAATPANDVEQTPSPAANPNQHPDLSDEVATLSTKLINAINHQTVLDDTLSATRHELETARETIRDLEQQLLAQRDMMSGEVWVRRSTLENERKKMQTEKRNFQTKIEEEKTKRIETEKEKRKIEQELENLTTALFEEANKMVIGAKEEAARDHEILQRKNDQLKSQLADSESLLKSQQEQLSELKQVMEIMVTERDDQASSNTAPSSPGISRYESKEDARSVTIALSPSSTHTTMEAPTPAPPTSFTHLIQPVLRNDLAAYDDFMVLAHLSRKRSGSRASSGSTGLGLGGSTSSAHPSNSSSGSLNAFAAAAATSSTPQSPNTPSSVSSNPSTPSLKDTRFYKRVLSEDVEPTLRLDTAPGLSWLARRSVIASMADGSLVVEPVPAGSGSMFTGKPQFYPCSMCGESRKNDLYLRNYRFRISEADSAQRYPLCNFCVTRVRSTCQFLGFLRMVKDGYWRADNEDHAKAAWEESVRLREQMFWARIGGGVIPLNPVEIHVDERSPRPSHEQSKTDLTALAVDKRSGSISSHDDASSTYDLERKDSVEEPRTPSEKASDSKDLRYSVQSLTLDMQSSSETSSEKRDSVAPEN